MSSLSNIMQSVDIRETLLRVENMSWKYIVLLLVAVPRYVMSQESIRVALLESYPWAYYSSAGEIIGIYPQIFSSIERQPSFPYKIHIEILPLSRVLKSMKYKSIDYSIMSYKPERAQTMEPITLIYRAPFVVYSLVSSPVSEIKDLRGGIMATLRGGSQCPCPNNIELKRYPVDSHYQALIYLKKQRVDSVSGPLLRLYVQAKRLNMVNDLNKPLIYEWRDVWLWSSKATKSISVDSMKLAWDKVIESKEIDKILKDYFEPRVLRYIIISQYRF